MSRDQEGFRTHIMLEDEKKEECRKGVIEAA